MSQNIFTLEDSLRGYQVQGSPRPFQGALNRQVNLEALSKKTTLNPDAELARSHGASATSLAQQVAAAKDIGGHFALQKLGIYKEMFPYMKAFQDAELNSGTYDTAQQTGAQMGSAAINALAGTGASIAAGLFGRR